MNNLHQVEARYPFPEKMSSVIKAYIADYAYSAQLYIAFVLAVTSSPEIKYNSIVIIRLSFSSKKFAWLVFIYLRRHMLDESQELSPALSLMLAVISVFSFDTPSTLRPNRSFPLHTDRSRPLFRRQEKHYPEHCSGHGKTPRTHYLPTPLERPWRHLCEPFTCSFGFGRGGKECRGAGTNVQERTELEGV